MRTRFGIGRFEGELPTLGVVTYAERDKTAIITKQTPLEVGRFEGESSFFDPKA